VSSDSAERTTWRGKGVHAGDLATGLDRLHHSLHDELQVQALARTLNLVVVPCSTAGEKTVEEGLDELGSHAPSRTIVLRRQRPDRLDAELTVVCKVADATGHLGVCYDEVVLTAGGARLEHAASLLAPLLVSDLPTVIWLPEPDSPIPDPRLLDRADHVLVDSAKGGESELRRLAELARRASVHDLAWGRLEFWRAGTAAAFDPPERRAMLPRIRGLDLHYEEDSRHAALLLAGWVAARAGWRPTAIEPEDGTTRVRAVREDGGDVALSLEADPAVPGCGGIEELRFRADPDEVLVKRRGATSRLRDLFAEALRPTPSFARGYAKAAQATLAMIGDG
jgi:glucose-6-phosphate dehydrogenase assembly protein OpcA